MSPGLLCTNFPPKWTADVKMVMPFLLCYCNSVGSAFPIAAAMHIVVFSKQIMQRAFNMHVHFQR